MLTLKTAVLSVLIGSCCYVAGTDTNIFVADKNGQKIYRLNSAGDVTKTFNYSSQVLSVAVDVYSPGSEDNPSFIYSLSGNESNNGYDSWIRRQDFRESHPEILLHLHDEAVDQIIVDPSSGNLYYTRFSAATYKSYIGVISRRGTDVPIISGLENGCCMALYPEKRLIFWTEDKYLSTKYVASANMDGSNVQYIVTTNLKHPMAIAVDYNADLLYWADWVSGKIERSNLAGGDRETFLETGHKIDYMDIDGGFLFYTTVGESVIRKVNLSNPNYRETLGSFPSGGYFIGLDIYPRHRSQTRPTVHQESCGIDDCSHLCIPMVGGRVCKCLEGHTLDKDGRTCKTESVISANAVMIILVGTCALLISLTIVGVCQKVRGSKAKTGSNKVANVLETKKGPAKIGKELEKKTVLA